MQEGTLIVDCVVDPGVNGCVVDIFVVVLNVEIDSVVVCGVVSGIGVVFGVVSGIGVVCGVVSGIGVVSGLTKVVVTCGVVLNGVVAWVGVIDAVVVLVVCLVVEGIVDSVVASAVVVSFVVVVPVIINVEAMSIVVVGKVEKLRNGSDTSTVALKGESVVVVVRNVDIS